MDTEKQSPIIFIAKYVMLQVLQPKNSKQLL